MNSILFANSVNLTHLTRVVKASLFSTSRIVAGDDMLVVGASVGSNSGTVKDPEHAKFRLTDHANLRITELHTHKLRLIHDSVPPRKSTARHWVGWTNS